MKDTQPPTIQQQQRVHHPHHAHIREWVAGCCGGVTQILSGHPLDTIKVNLQSSSGPSSVGKISHLMRDIVKTKGILGLYRGAASPLFGACILNSVEFGVYNECKEWMQDNSTQEQLPLYKIAIAGAVSGVFGSIVTTPTEYLKCNLQVESKVHHTRFSGPFDLMRHLYRHQQVLNSNRNFMDRFMSYAKFYQVLNRGFVITTFREAGLALYFGAYEATVRFLHKHFSHKENSHKPPTWHSLIGGGMGGLVFWTVMYPVDMIKTRVQIDSVQHVIQQQHASQHNCVKYLSSWETMKQIHTESGVLGFFSGYKSAIVRAIIVNAVVFATYEQVKSWKL